MPPQLPGGTRSFPTRRNERCGWATHTRIDENPVIRGHDLYFGKTCRGNHLAICDVAGCGKTDRIMTRP